MCQTLSVQEVVQNFRSKIQEVTRQLIDMETFQINGQQEVDIEHIDILFEQLPAKTESVLKHTHMLSEKRTYSVVDVLGVLTSAESVVNQSNVMKLFPALINLSEEIANAFSVTGHQTKCIIDPSFECLLNREVNNIHPHLDGPTVDINQCLVDVSQSQGNTFTQLKRFKQRTTMSVVPPKEDLNYRRPTGVLLTPSNLFVVFEIGMMTKWRVTTNGYTYTDSLHVQPGARYIADVLENVVALTYKSERLITLIEKTSLTIQTELKTAKAYSSICRLDNERFLATNADRENASVDVISSKGNILLSVHGLQINDIFGVFGHLSNISLTSQGNIVIANWGVVICLSPNLERVLWWYEIEAEQNEQRSIFIVCAGDYVYVCCPEQRIIRLTEEGGYVCTYRNDVKEPFGFSILANRVVVSQFLSNNIYIYEL